MFNVKINNGEAYKVQVSPEGNAVLNDREMTIDVVKNGDGSFHLLSGGRSFRIQVQKTVPEEKLIVFRMNGVKYEASLKDKFDELIEKMGLGSALSGKLNEFKAPMPGLVLDVFVQEGSEVSKGEPMIVLEAMKMENVLKAPGDGVVKKIHVDKKQAVEKNQVLISFD